MNDTTGSEYLHWIKTQNPGRFSLATSGVAPYSIRELAVRIEDVELNGLHLYGYQPLQEAIAAHCRVPVESVVATSGTSMANFLALAALVHPGDEVAIEDPVYEPLAAAVNYFGGSLRPFKRDSEAGFDVPAAEDVSTDRTKLIILTNLHNPSCVFTPEAALRRYGEIARRVGARVLVDEVYLECMYEKFQTAFSYGAEFVVTSSLTKAYGLSGLRCGWILAEPELAKRMWKIKDLVDPSAAHPAELLSVMAFRELNRIAARAKTLLAKNRALVRDFLDGCDELECVWPEFGTCIFPRLKRGDADRFVAMLHERYDTDVVPGRFFGMPDHFRLGIGSETATLAAGLERLKTALA